ncbi:MAG: IclR family transcriptional regulator [Rhodoplanes sp.]|uniref:IclR family transcriptional regulator n=1 Tax=Rhodoplanes sp. TaxID=1968906 RepID=UPI0017DDFB90|nr:IclR family transcriptional regulator [Rhodoplanes sp.]NVO15308.1 IclR family transcriptional regulator [Rhodoplanes sp.]
MAEDSVRSVERALSLLRCFDLNTEALTLTELSEKLSLAPSTTLRLATVLTAQGFLQRSKVKTYSLGNAVYLLGAVAKSHFKLHNTVLPHMLALRDACKEAVTLYAMEGGYRVVYEHVESLRSMRCVVRVSDRFPLWAGAAGKCLLAYADAETVEEEIAKVRPIAPGTILDPDRFRRELAEIRRNGGRAVSHGEREEGITSTAVPIFCAPDKIAFALTVSAPSSRVDSTGLRSIFELSIQASRDIERLLRP